MPGPQTRSPLPDLAGRWRRTRGALRSSSAYRRREDPSESSGPLHQGHAAGERPGTLSCPRPRRTVREGPTPSSQDTPNLPLLFLESIPQPFLVPIRNGFSFATRKIWIWIGNRHRHSAVQIHVHRCIKPRSTPDVFLDGLGVASLSKSECRHITPYRAGDVVGRFPRSRPYTPMGLESSGVQKRPRARY